MTVGAGGKDAALGADADGPTDENARTRPMPDGVERLFSGYRQFREHLYPGLARLYDQLAQGQAPKVMVIACADSRVSPSMIFSAGPGELFTVRNVANLVPPCEAGGLYHGTSAALEFAVTALAIEHIVVFGHAQCGGIAACLAAHEGLPAGQFITPWVDLAAPARDEVVAARPDLTPEALQYEVELMSIRHSLRNLATFPFVQEAEGARRLTLHGAWFSVASGELHWLDRRTGAFSVVADSE